MVVSAGHFTVTTAGPGIRDLARISHEFSKRGGEEAGRFKASEGLGPEPYLTVRRGPEPEATQKIRAYLPSQPKIHEKSGLECVKLQFVGDGFRVKLFSTIPQWTWSFRDRSVVLPRCFTSFNVNIMSLISTEKAFGINQPFRLPNPISRRILGCENSSMSSLLS